MKYKLLAVILLLCFIQGGAVAEKVNLLNAHGTVEYDGGLAVYKKYILISQGKQII